MNPPWAQHQQKEYIHAYENNRKGSFCFDYDNITYGHVSIVLTLSDKD